MTDTTTKQYRLTVVAEVFTGGHTLVPFGDKTYDTWTDAHNDRLYLYTLVGPNVRFQIQEREIGAWGPAPAHNVDSPYEDGSIPTRCPATQTTGMRCLRPAGHPPAPGNEHAPDKGHDYGGVYPDALTVQEWKRYQT